MNKHMNRRRFSASLALTAVATAALLTGCGKVPDTIKIGVAQPLSGPLGALGQDLLNGVKLAVEELNKSGYTVDGKRVTLEVVSVDDKADATTGKAVAQQLVDAGVVAVVGHLNSGVSIETAPIYAAKDIPQIAISTNPKFTQLGFPTTFRMVANDTLQARAIGSFAATQLGANRYAALDDGTRTARASPMALPNSSRPRKRKWWCASRSTTRPWPSTSWPVSSRPPTWR